jgi:hypothetical protein
MTCLTTLLSGTARSLCLIIFIINPVQGAIYAMLTTI